MAFRSICICTGIPRPPRCRDPAGGDYRFTPHSALPGISAGPTLKTHTMKNVTKDQFISLLDEAGINDEQKQRLHAAFEKQHPEAHQAFLEWLGLPSETVREIREHSRAA